MQKSQIMLVSVLLVASIFKVTNQNVIQEYYDTQNLNISKYIQIKFNENNKNGILGIKFPWPSIARTIYGDHERYKNVYFSAYPGYYFPGDGAFRDDEGNYRIEEKRNCMSCKVA